MNTLFLGTFWDYPTSENLMSVHTKYCQLLYVAKHEKKKNNLMVDYGRPFSLQALQLLD